MVVFILLVKSSDQSTCQQKVATLYHARVLTPFGVADSLHSRLHVVASTALTPVVPLIPRRICATRQIGALRRACFEALRSSLLSQYDTNDARENHGVEVVTCHV